MKTITPIYVLILLLSTLLAGNCFAESGADQISVDIPGREVKIDFQKIDENKVLVSALDADDNPVKGLLKEDFTVQKGTKEARVTNAEVLKTRKDVGLNIVLVIDNSSSMKKRKAVKPLLNALDDFLKIVRPIDNVEVVVFDQKKQIPVDGNDLHLDQFASSDVIDLKSFFSTSFEDKLSSQTFLYDGMVAGLDRVSRMPEKSNKFMVVFTDGEDLNSINEKKDVLAKTEGIKNFNAYSIDFMPTKEIDEFLKRFSEATGGNILKADSAGSLLPVFKKVSTTLLHRYVVEYEFLNPPKGHIELGAHQLHFDVLRLLDGRPLPYYVFFETGKSTIHPTYQTYTDPADTKRFAEKEFGTVLEKYFHILNFAGKKLSDHPEETVRIIGCNSNQGEEKNNLQLSENRAEAVMTYLRDIWGIDEARMKLISRNLPETPSPKGTVGSRPENQRVEIVFSSQALQKDSANDFVFETSGRKSVEIQPDITAEYEIASWEVAVKDSRENLIKTYTGNDTISNTYVLDLTDLSADTLINLGFLQAEIAVVDINRDRLDTKTGKCRVAVDNTEIIHKLVTPTRGVVRVTPDTVTIEEVSVIDSSPLLNYVFFKEGEMDFPERYNILKDQDEAEKFDEKKLRDTISKYKNVLNIIGKRLVENPQATIEITGCISDYGKEKDKTDLSKLRAEEVRAYLQYIWGIDRSRMTVIARKRPAHPSTSRAEMGRKENQRVEITSDVQAILDSIKSSYVFAQADSYMLSVKPEIQVGYDLDQWRLNLYGDDNLIKSVKGEGNDIPAYEFNLEKHGLKDIGAFETVSAQIEMTDVRGKTYTTNKADVGIEYIKRVEREAKKQGYKVIEKYALILFDYDSAEIKARNKVVLDRVISRIKELPSATVSIVGHTDIIGEKEYNIKLSQRRAKAVYDKVIESGIDATEQIAFRGDGPDDPPYNNSTPEGRAFNRTVTIAIEYEKNATF